MADDRITDLYVEPDDCFGSDDLALMLGANTNKPKVRAIDPDALYEHLRHWAQLDIAHRLKTGSWSEEPDAPVQLAS